MEGRIRAELKTDDGLQRHLFRYYGPTSKLAASHMLKSVKMADVTDYSQVGVAVSFVAQFSDAIRWASMFKFKQSDIGRIFLRAIRPRPLAEWIRFETSRRDFDVVSSLFLTEFTRLNNNQINLSQLISGDNNVSSGRGAGSAGFNTRTAYDDTMPRSSHQPVPQRTLYPQFRKGSGDDDLLFLPDFGGSNLSAAPNRVWPIHGGSGGATKLQQAQSFDADDFGENSYLLSV